MQIRYVARIEAPTDRNASGIQILHTCEALGLLGHEVELIVLGRRTSLRIDPFEYFDVQRTFKIRPLWTMADLIPRPLLSGRWGARIEIILQLLAAKMYLVLKRYDILYTREPLAALFFRDVVLEVHTLPDSMKGMSGSLHRKAQSLVAISEGLKRRLVDHGVRKERVLVAPDGVDLETFGVRMTKAEARQQLALPLGASIIVYTGRISARRGLDVLADAAKRLPQEVLVYAVGGAEIGSDEFLKNLEGIDNFHLVGYRAHQEMPVWQRAADILVLPSTASDRILREYTSPMKLFEYMAAERPIVSSDLPSIREVLDDTSALLVPSGDSKALARAFEYALSDVQASENRAEKAYALVRSYTWDERARKITQFLEEIAS